MWLLRIVKLIKQLVIIGQEGIKIVLFHFSLIKHSLKYYCNIYLMHRAYVSARFNQTNLIWIFWSLLNDLIIVGWINSFQIEAVCRPLSGKRIMYLDCLPREYSRRSPCEPRLLPKIIVSIVFATTLQHCSDSNKLVSPNRQCVWAQ